VQIGWVEEGAGTRLDSEGGGKAIWLDVYHFVVRRLSFLPRFPRFSLSQPPCNLDFIFSCVCGRYWYAFSTSYIFLSSFFSYLHGTYFGPRLALS